MATEKRLSCFPEKTKQFMNIFSRTDGVKNEFSGAHRRPRTGDFTIYTVLSFEAS